MKIINANVYTKDFVFKKQDIFIQDDKFAMSCSDNEVFDAQGLMAIPGLLDIHFHGAVGYDLMDATDKSLRSIAQYEASIGVTSICPASMTMSEDDILKAMENAAQFKADDKCANLVGIYMEGPFISPNKVGAQNPKFVQNPNLQFFNKAQQKARDLIKILAIAPETLNGIDTIKALQGKVQCSIAHTCATYDEAKEAVENGATHITHLFNAMPGFEHRNPGPIGACAEAKKCDAELICDGIHLHPSTVRLAFKLFGKEQIILISDSMMAVGLENGEYTLGGQKVFVKDRKATLQSGTIAGSATNLYECMKICHQQMGIALEDAIRAATYNPARSIGVLDKVGTIENNKSADLLLVDKDLNIKKIILRGKFL